MKTIFNDSFTSLHDLGFSVFPIPHGSKIPNSGWKKYQSAKPTIEQCQKWDEGEYNIAIATGNVSGIFVVDIDGEAGEKTIQTLEAQYGKLPETVSVKTGRGKHLYFHYPDGDCDIRNLASKSAQGEELLGVDVRGNGGYVVAPPSLHPDGGHYEWLLSPSTSSIAVAPQWLLDLMTQSSQQWQEYASTEQISESLINELIGKECAILEDAEEGERNDQLNRAAFALGQYIHLGLPEAHVREALKESALKIGLEGREIESTITSGLNGGKKNPRAFNDRWDNPDMGIITRRKAELPECPYHLLGAEIKQYIEDAAACKSAPPDYVLAGLLNAAAGLIGNARQVEIWGGWNEATALWFMLVGLPSCNKSPALDAVFPVVRDFEAQYHQQYKLEMQDYKIALEQYRAMKQMKGKKDAPDPTADMTEPVKPIMKRIIVNDTTVEKLALLLADNRKGLIYQRDELAGLLANLEKNGGNDRPMYLESFGGRPMSIDRVKYDDVIYVPSVLLSIIGSIQPDKLDQLLLRQPDDGFASRFLYVSGVPRTIKEPDVMPDYDMLKGIFKVLEELDVPLDDDGTPRPKLIPICPDGRRLMEAFGNRMQSYEEKEHGMVISHLGKLRGIAARIALVIQYIEWAFDPKEEPSEIGFHHVENAIYMAEHYFYPMAKHCLGNVSMPEDEQDGLLVAKWIVEQQRQSINAREVLRDIIPYRDPKRRDAALLYLEESGWLRRKESVGKSVNYDVNQRIHAV